MNNKIKIMVVFYKRDDKMLDFENGTFTEPQEKTFNDIDSCFSWCMKNHAKLFSINDFRTFGESISHFDIMDAINGMER